MSKPVAAAVLAVLLTPFGAAAQNGAGWWSPLAELIPTSQDRPAICTLAPDLPACREANRDRDRQSRDRDDDRWDDDDRSDDDDRWDDDDRRDARRGNGPPFCRNGKGHPVHGRQWCRDKGWDNGRQGGWRDVGWEDVIFGPRDSGTIVLDPRSRDGKRTRNLDRGGLLDVLGSVVLGRLDSESRSLGGGELNGRLVEGRTRVLQVRAGSVPLAELMDVDRDGRVDRILIRDGR